jgi:hypothetical protein
MHMKILSHVRVCGETCEPDEVVDLPEADAKTLLSLGKAELYVAPGPVLANGDPTNPSNRDPKVEA